MAKKAKDKPVVEKDQAIISATVTDDLCNYSYKILRGVGEGNTHNVKGTGLVDNDLIDALRSFNVHLACIDDVFRHSGVAFDSIESMQNHELTSMYFVTGFKIKGSGDDESIILQGTKSIKATGGRIDLETPKIPMDSLSSYTWWNELKTCADNARMEVELYHEGKCTPVEAKEPEDANQLKITDNVTDDQFENAKV